MNQRKKIVKNHDNKRDLLIKEERKIYLSRKDICNHIRTLTNPIPGIHHEWQLRTKELNQLILCWKKITKSTNKHKRISILYRNTIKDFNRKKSLFYRNQKIELKKNLQIKERICKKAESLQDSNKWKETSKKIVKLQLEWKESPFVLHSKSSRIWKRFQKSCNHFFRRRKKYYLKSKKSQKKHSPESIRKELPKRKYEILINERRLISDKIDQVNTNINQYENNILFFKKNDEKSNMLKENILKKIKLEKEEIKKLNEQLKTKI